MKPAPLMSRPDWLDGDHADIVTRLAGQRIEWGTGAARVRTVIGIKTPSSGRPYVEFITDRGTRNVHLDAIVHVGPKPK